MADGAQEDAVGMMRAMGAAAKAAAAELAYASAERKHAALIGAAQYNRAVHYGTNTTSYYEN